MTIYIPLKMCHWSGLKMSSPMFPGVPFDITSKETEVGFLPCYSTKEAALKAYPNVEIMEFVTLEKINE